MAEEGEESTATEEVVPSWEEVKQSAADGQLVMVDNDAPFRCASATADLYYAVSSVRSYADRNTNCDIPLSTLEEGKIFAGRIAAKRAEFLAVLDQVLESVRVRHDTFVDAGNLAEKMDSEAAEGFSRLSLTDFIYTPPAQMTRGAPLLDGGGSGNSDPLFIDNFHAPDPATDPADGVTAHTEVELSTTGFVNPTSYDPNASAYLMTYELGEHIRSNFLSEVLTDLASAWGQIGIVLNRVFEDYVDVLKTLTVDDWEGDGAAAAIAAIEGDKASVVNICPGPFGMRDLCTYLAHWFERAAQGLPTDPEVPTTQTIVPDSGWGFYMPASYVFVPYYENDGTYYEEVDENLIKHYLGVMEETYTTPLEVADANLPILPEFMKPSAGNFNTEPIPETDTSLFDPNAVSVGGGGSGGGLDLAGYQSTPAIDTEADIRTAQDLAEQQAQDLAEQQAQQAQQQMVPQLMQAVQQGLGTVQQALQDAARQSLANSMPPDGLPTAGLPPGHDPTKTAGLPGLNTGGPKGGPGGALSNVGNAPGVSRPPTDTARLFPRAGMPGGSTPMTGMGGQQASGMPAGGAPMGGGGAPGGGGRGQGDDKHERAKYLDRADNIDEGLGDAVDMTRPVIGETGNRSPAEQPQQPVVHRQRPATAPAPEPAPVRPSRSEDRVIMPGREGA
ncbi:hypothetical protein [Nocardia fusca]|uniref:Uncharacterized protein n=1 Tax=Nocardia fusca TaxID=941183 RepID=A0ABV3FDM9_9NOCA